MRYYEHDLKKIDDINEIKKLLVNILKAFTDLCQTHGLKYYLSGGTLLGAARHEGFIPWDDDIDVSMPREDYEKFLQIANGSVPSDFSVYSYRNDPKHIYPFAKMYDNRTYLREFRHIHNKNSGVFIDIFPVDGVSSFKLFKKQLRKIRFYRQFAKLAGTSVFRSKKSFSTFPRLMAVLCCKAVGSRFFLKKIDNIARGSMSDQPFCAVKVWGYGEREIFDSSVFLNTCSLKFEGDHYLVPIKYETYLESLYGDYMTLPPEDERVHRHEYDAFWRKSSIGDK